MYRQSYFADKRRRCGSSLELLEQRQMLTVMAELVADIRPGQKGSAIGAELFEYRGELFFSADDGSRGKELWKTDGTESGTALIRDINAGGDEDSSIPGWFAEYNSGVFFAANDGIAGIELWTTDGTAEGTTLIKDIFQGASDGAPFELTIFKNEIYFSATDGAHGTELWKSDGTAAGTVLVKDIRQGEGSSFPGDFSGFFELNGHLYFDASDGDSGVELWRTDGSPEGTERVIDADPGETSSFPTHFIHFKNDLYFTAEIFNSDFGSFFSHIFRVDSETGSAEQAIDWPIDFSEGVTLSGDMMYFAGLHPDYGFELFRSDGTQDGTTLVRDIAAGENDSDPRNLLVDRDQIYFAAGDSRDPETERTIFNLWVTDGTPLGTRKVSDHVVDPNNPFVVYRGEIYFTAHDEEVGWELFKTDGTQAGTRVVHDVYAGENDSLAIPKAVFEDKLLFIATEISSGWEIWAHDGATTQMVEVHFGGGDFTDEPTQFEFVEFGNNLVFIGSNPFEGDELYIIRGSEPSRIPGDADGNGLVDFDDFVALAGNFGRQNAVWEEGDFDGNGLVNFDDFVILSLNFGKSSTV